MSENGLRAKFHTFSDGITDLTPVRAIPGLHGVECYGLRADQPGILVSLEPLRGLVLDQIGFTWNPVVDLEPLRGMPLHSAWLSRIATRDFSPLEGAPLVDFHATSTTGVSPPISLLLSAPLNDIWVEPDHVPDLDRLRSHPTLKTFNDMPIAEFWSLRDRKLKRPD